MPLTIKVLTEILNRGDNLCCLCLNSTNEKSVKLQDEIIIENSINYGLDMYGVINFLLGDAFKNMTCISNAVCEDCSVTAIQSYKFMKKSFEVASELSKGVTELLECLDNTNSNKITKARYLFVALDPVTCESKSYFDNQKKTLYNMPSVLKRFQSVVNKKDKVKIMSSDHNYSCTECGTICSSKYTLKRHLKMYCKKSNNDSDDFDGAEGIFGEDFLADNQNNENVVKIARNQKSFRLSKSYNGENEFSKYPQIKMVTSVCSKCGKILRADRVKEHELTHKRMFVCERCFKVYKTFKSFQNHSKDLECHKHKEREPLPKVFICDMCNKQFGRRASLVVHIRLEHSIENHHVCPWCNKKFLCDSRLKDHIVKHTQEKKFECTICGGKFVSRPSLLYHTRLHTGEKPYKCKFCEYTFLSASRRADHVRVQHSTASIECEVCTKKFSLRSRLLKHMKKHNNPQSNLYIGAKNFIAKPE